MALIIIEGIPGSGKSTTARFIALQAERNGLKVELLHESASGHPLILQESIPDPEEWMRQYKANWETFLLNHNDQETTVVMEAVLYQNPIIQLLHMDIDRDRIVSFVEELHARLSNINCRLIYLYQNDPVVGIHRKMEAGGGRKWLEQTYATYKDEPYYRNRGQQNADLHLAFLREYARLSHLVFSRSRLHAFAVENTAWNWPTYHRELLEYLEWDHMPDPVVPLAELQKYTGSYYNAEMKLEIRIDLIDGQLFIFDKHKLKSKAKHRFYLDDISLSVHFIADRLGVFHRLVVEEKDIMGNRKEEGTCFVRVPNEAR